MIEGGDEYAQNNKGGPLRVHRSHSNLKNKTNRQSHEEHRTRNNVGFDHNPNILTGVVVEGATEDDSFGLLQQAYY